MTAFDRRTSSSPAIREGHEPESSAPAVADDGVARPIDADERTRDRKERDHG